MRICLQYVGRYIAGMVFVFFIVIAYINFVDAFFENFNASKYILSNNSVRLSIRSSWKGLRFINAKCVFKLA